MRTWYSVFFAAVLSLTAVACDGFLDVDAKPDEQWLGYVTLRVEDRGCGIDTVDAYVTGGGWMSAGWIRIPVPGRYHFEADRRYNYTVRIVAEGREIATDVFTVDTDSYWQMVREDRRAMSGQKFLTLEDVSSIWFSCK